MKIRFAGAARRVLLSTLIALGAAPLAAQAYTYSVLIDSDNDAATGCSVVTPNGTAAGIDARLDAEVSFEPLLVQTQALRLCSGGSFGAPQSLPAGHPVGADRGPGPSDVVELGFERALLGEDIASDWNLTFLASSPLLGAADAAGPVLAVGVGMERGKKSVSVYGASFCGAALAALLLSIVAAATSSSSCTPSPVCDSAQLSEYATSAVEDQLTSRALQ